MRDILVDIQKRREANEDPCDSCNATGLYEGKVCTDCLGQKVLLKGEEYEILLKWAYRIEDEILDQQDFLD